MLCEKCTNVVFIEENASEYDILYYDQHENQQLLWAKKDQCHLCWKIWHGLNDEFERCQESADGAFEESEPATIRFRILASTELLSEGKVEKNSDSYEFWISCGKLTITADYFISPTGSLCDILCSQYLAIPPSTRISANPNTVSKPNLHLARQWLDNCSNFHEPCQNHDKIRDLPLRILDISQEDTVRLRSGFGTQAAYATLSYMWGDGTRVLLTSQNISDWRHGVAPSSLPRTFSEAVETARYLGFSYLWIDALCIQQDSPNELEEQVTVMGDIFGNSSLTLFAGAGDSVHCGLATDRDPVLVQPTKVSITAIVEDDSYYRIIFVQSFTDLDDDENEDLPLFHRGWVLQEEVLSYRALIFANGEARWRCMCEEATERNLNGTPKQHIRKNRGKFDSFHRFRIRLLGADPFAEEQESFLAVFDREDILDDWYSLIEDYSTRQLTFSSDVLPATSGLASTLQTLRGYTYMAGLWEEDIQLGLLWRVEYGDLFHSDSEDSTQEKVDDFQLVGASYSKAPSWSWISRFGTGRQIMFEHKRRYRREEEYGIRLVDRKIVYPPYSSNIYGQITSALLTVLACTKWGEVRVSEHNPSGFGNLYDLHPKRNRYEPVASFWPDDIETTYNEDGRLQILCLLCAVAELEVDRVLKGNTATTGIGVVPSSDHPGKYKRVGLLMFHYKHNDWFARFGSRRMTTTNSERTSDLAEGASMATIELI